MVIDAGERNQAPFFYQVGGFKCFMGLSGKTVKGPANRRENGLASFRFPPLDGRVSGQWIDVLFPRVNLNKNNKIYKTCCSVIRIN